MNPLFYTSDEINAVNKLKADKIWKRDEKRKILLENAGYQVKIIWENDIK